MNSMRMDKATVTMTNGQKAVVSWVEIDNDHGRGYHEIAWWTKGSKGRTNILDSHLSRDEACTVFYLLLQGKLLINPDCEYA